MKNAETFRQFLQTEVIQAPVLGILANLILAALLGLLIGRIYVRCGTSLSNRRSFAHNFVLLTMTTMLIITLIQSNVVLSLGMIGALSIVRFRSAIKEPEELSYLFLSIAVGLGLGANQRLITIASLVAIIGIIFVKQWWDHRNLEPEQNLYLTVTTHAPQQLSLNKIGEILDTGCSLHRMKRIDRTKDSTEACFLVELKNQDSMHLVDSKLRENDESIKVSFLDFRGGMLGTP